jgi:hypothetical protein
LGLAVLGSSIRHSRVSGRAAHAEAAARLVAISVASAGRLSAKQVVEKGEYPHVRTRGQFADLIEEVILKGESKSLGGRRTGYWYDGTFVVRNPKDPDGGKAYRETLDYFKRQR